MADERREPDDMEPEDLPRAPAGLVEAVRAQNARVLRVTDHAPRYHVRLSSPSGLLFGWYSTDRRGPEVLRHELQVRAALGEEGMLRGPPVLAHGANWRVERMIPSDPLEGRTALGLVTKAALEIAEANLPERSFLPRTRREKAARARRRVETLTRLGLSPLPLRDWWLARQLVRDSTLPRLRSHGSFIPVHLLLHGSAVYVIDWEDLGERPLGWDLMQLWAALPDAGDRAELMELAVDALGREAMRDLLQLRFAALVSRIVSKVAEHHQFGERDPAAARALLALLPEVRSEALRGS